MNHLTEKLKASLKASEFVFGELEHPNKMPFSGLMTWFDVPSDKAVGGSGGKKVVIPSDYGIKALDSIKGMAVNFDSIWMDKHSTTHKIGIIEDYEIGEVAENGGTPVFVSGFIYAHDFQAEAIQIKEEQSDLGFSYETIDTPVIDGVFQGNPVLYVSDDFVFSGAAILLKEKGAYTNTSLAAQAEEIEKEVTDLDLEKIITAVTAALEAKYDLTAKAVEEVVETEVEAVTEPVEETVVEDETVVETVVETEVVAETVVEEVVEETVVEALETDLNAEAEVVDFKAQAEDFKARLDAANAQLADLKAEADAIAQNTHKGFAYPMTLAAKFNLNAEADSYEGKISAVDARTDLNISEKMALKFELRDAQLKLNK